MVSNLDGWIIFGRQNFGGKLRCQWLEVYLSYTIGWKKFIYTYINS